MKLLKDQRGLAHIVEIVVIAIIVLGLGGFVVWRIVSTQSGVSNLQLQQAINNAQCASDDKDVCKFFAVRKVPAEVHATATITVEDKTTTSTYQAEASTKRYRIVQTINDKPFETIFIDNVVYTKDNRDSKWWRQTVQPAQAEATKESFGISLDESTGPFNQPAKYTRVAAEQCGNLTCLKYKVDLGPGGIEQFVWFDDRDYLMRRIVIQQPDGKTDQTFDYRDVTITEPSPTKDIPAGMYLLPGSDEPVQVPIGTDLPLGL